MRNLFFFLLILAGCSSGQKDIRSRLSLAGEWKFKIDSLDQGVKKEWFNEPFEETVKLPGSMAENGKGEERRRAGR